MQKNTTLPTRVADRLHLFPDSTTIENDSLLIAGHDLASLADEYGTPLYIYDRATMDAAAADYQSALQRYFPGSSQITYAGKAFLCKAIAGWTQAHDMLVDCTGEGEIAIALAAGVPSENILVHGVNKSVADIKSALQNARVIVVDNLSELHNMESNSLLFEVTEASFLAPKGVRMNKLNVPGPKALALIERDRRVVSCARADRRAGAWNEGACQRYPVERPER